MKSFVCKRNKRENYRATVLIISCNLKTFAFSFAGYNIKFKIQIINRAVWSDIYVPKYDVPINHSSTARSLCNDRRSITAAFNSFSVSWSSLAPERSWTDRRFARRSITLSPFESPWNAIWESSGDSFSSATKEESPDEGLPRGMFVRFAAITGYPRWLYPDGARARA